MIHLQRTDSSSIRLLIDKAGLAELLFCFRSALDGGHQRIDVKFDMSVIRMKRRARTEFKGILIETGKETMMLLQQGEPVWTIDREDLESAIDQLVRGESLGYVSPAEFMQVKIPKNKKLDYVFCELVRSFEERSES